MKVPLAKKDCKPSFSAPFDDQNTSGRAEGVDDKDLTLRREEGRSEEKKNIIPPNLLSSGLAAITSLLR